MIVALAAIVPYMEAGDSSYRREVGQITWSVIMGSSIRANVTVLGDSPDTQFIADSLAEVAQRVLVVGDSASFDADEVLCVDCTGMTEERLFRLTAPIRTFILRGAPVIFVNDTSGAMARAIDGQKVSCVSAIAGDGSPIAVRALKHDPLGGRSGSLDLGGSASDRGQLTSALRIAHNWSADRLKNANSSGELDDRVRVYAAFSYSYCSGEACAPYGRFAVSNTYIRTIWNTAQDEDWWSVHYRMESDPGYGAYDNDHRTGKMTVGSTFGSGAVLSRHYPGTAYGTDSVGIYLSPDDHGGFGRWEYSIRGVTVLDHSNSGLGMFSLDHVPDRGSEASKGPYAIEPGAGVRADRDAGITFQESYSIDWQRPSLFTWESRSVSLTVEGRVK